MVDGWMKTQVIFTFTNTYWVPGGVPNIKEMAVNETKVLS